MRQCRAPGVEHGGDADARCEMARIGGDGQHGLRGRPEQQVVDHGLVLGCDVGDLGRQREHDVEVADRQQVGLARFQPFACSRSLALWTVPVAAAVVRDAAVAAVLTALDVAAEGDGAAGLDRRHDLELAEADVPGMGRSPGGPRVGGRCRRSRAWDAPSSWRSAACGGSLGGWQPDTGRDLVERAGDRAHDLGGHAGVERGVV